MEVHLNLMQGVLWSDGCGVEQSASVRPREGPGVAMGWAWGRGERSGRQRARTVGTGRTGVRARAQIRGPGHREDLGRRRGRSGRSEAREAISDASAQKNNTQLRGFVG